MEDKYDTELLRKQILEAMQGDSYWGYRLHELRDRVYSNYPSEDHSKKLMHLIFEESFRMVSEGLIRPNLHFPGDGSVKPQWEAFQLTSYGRMVVEGKSEHPAFVDDYIKRLRTMTPDEIMLDEVVEFYARESAQLFRHEFYASSVVMLGVASEQIVDMVGSAILETLKEPTKGKFRKVMNHRSVSDKIDTIRSTFESSCTDQELRDFFDHSFTGFVTLLRKSRNEYGHPSGTSTTRDEALEYLYTYPQYIKRMYQVIHYYSNRRMEGPEE